MGKKSRNGQARWKRHLFYYSRLVHIYLSSLLFALLILFCVSGLLLNHLEWIDNDHLDGEHEIALTPPHYLAVKDEGGQLAEESVDAVRQLLATEFNLHNPAAITIDSEFGEVSFDYKLPAGYAFAIADLDSQSLLIEYRRGGVWTVMNDLHKGRNTGAVWSWVIDLSAVLVVLFAVTGLIILFQNRKQRSAATITLILGSLTPLIIYFLWVPRLLGVN